ncbi:hypothetical protein AB0C14_34765 [Microbispora hainanensis]|uniref:hypothetical protein n=1 Tax=Microbispora hainanensis TaxID=568844 RepID=UPI0033C03FF0
MTYDIYFVRRRPGRTVVESIEDANEEMESADAWWMGDGDPEPVILTQQQRAAWVRIVRRAAEELGPVEVEEFLPGPTLCRNGPRGRLQLDYAGEDASIAIPYWYWGEEAISVAEDAYRLARLVEEESGLAGYDPQADQDTMTGDAGKAAARLGGVAQWAQENLT